MKTAERKLAKKHRQLLSARARFVTSLSRLLTCILELSLWKERTRFLSLITTQPRYVYQIFARTLLGNLHVIGPCAEHQSRLQQELEDEKQLREQVVLQHQEQLRDELGRY